jgi:hypothetical protein
MLEKKNSYGWKKSGIIEEKHERMFFKVVKKKKEK